MSEEERQRKRRKREERWERFDWIMTIGELLLFLPRLLPAVPPDI